MRLRDIKTHRVIFCVNPVKIESVGGAVQPAVGPRAAPLVFALGSCKSLRVQTMMLHVPNATLPRPTQVNLVSEHIWCEDFLVRSFYLKNLQTNETRTVTQFHFLSWCDRGVPSSARSLLDFRRYDRRCTGRLTLSRCGRQGGGDAV